MTRSDPRTIDEYLDRLDLALQSRGADPALIQDALYDAEEHLRSEFAESPGIDEATLLAKIASSYGAPDEVADIYCDKEQQVEQALRAPPPRPRTSALGRLFGVAADPRAYAALFFMLLSLITGTFYFVWAVTGLSLSLGLIVLVIGLPFAALFIGTVRVLSLVEGRLVEVMLGVRMPRRPLYRRSGEPLMARIKGMFADPRTWSTLFYMIVTMPLGILYFTVAVTGLSLSIALMVAPFFEAATGWGFITIDNYHYSPPLWAAPFTIALGFLIFCALLHVARGVAHVHGALAKHLLVKTAA